MTIQDVLKEMRDISDDRWEGVAPAVTIERWVDAIEAAIEDAYREGWQQAAGYNDVFLADLLDEDWSNSDAAFKTNPTP